MDTWILFGYLRFEYTDTGYLVLWYTDTGYLVPMVSSKYPGLRILVTYCSPVAY